MRHPRRTLLPALLSAALLFAGRPAHAADTGSAQVPVPVLATPSAVHAGDEVAIHWSQPGARVEELEVLLSLDGGRTWHVRVSPSLGSDRTRWSWRVPNLPSAAARIRIRARLDGEEVVGEAGEPFTILGDPSLPLARAVFSEGGWWRGFDLPLALPVAFGATDQPRIGMPQPGLDGAPAPRVATPAPSTDVVAVIETPRAFRSPVASRPSGRAPEVVPLRN